MAEARRVLLLGVGNPLRGDDGVGIAVARRLRERTAPPGLVVGEQPGEVSALLDTWAPYDALVAVDAMRSGAAAGTVRRLEASGAPLPGRRGGAASAHGLGLGEAIELGRALGRLPADVVVFAVEGAAFIPGTGPSPAVAAVVDDVAQAAWTAACGFLAE